MFQSSPSIAAFDGYFQYKYTCVYVCYRTFKSMTSDLAMDLNELIQRPRQQSGLLMWLFKDPETSPESSLL